MGKCHLNQTYLRSEILPTSLKKVCMEMDTKQVHFPTGTLLSALMDVAAGMNFLHILNIVHRDMHLDNFLVSHDFTVKVCDFGMGKAIDTDASNTADIGAELVRAPESYTTNHGLECDVWSYGILVSMLFKIGKNLPHLHGKETDRSAWFEEQPEDPERLKYFKKLQTQIGSVIQAKVASYRKTALENMEGPFQELARKCLSFLYFNRPSFSGLVESLLDVEKVTGIRRQRIHPFLC